MKQKYKGIFNYQGEVHIIYRYAPKGLEWKILTKAIAKILGVDHYSIRQYFSGRKDNFSIKEE